MDVSIGKQNIKIMKNNVFWHKKLSKSRRLIHLCKNMIISFCNTFLQNFPRVMRHIKIKQFKEKIKNCQNHEGSCIYGYIFWYPKKLLLLSIAKRHQFWTLLESGIGGLRATSIFWIIKVLSKILHGYYTTFVFLEFWKKLINSSKSAKQVGQL